MLLPRCFAALYDSRGKVHCQIFSSLLSFAKILSKKEKKNTRAGKGVLKGRLDGQVTRDEAKNVKNVSFGEDDVRRNEIVRFPDRSDELPFRNPHTGPLPFSTPNLRPQHWWMTPVRLAAHKTDCKPAPSAL